MASYNFKKNILPLLIKIGIGLGIGVLVVLLTQDLFFEIGFIKKVDYLTMDYRYQKRYERLLVRGEAKDLKTTGDVVIIGISEEDSKAMPKSFPFPRSYYAHLIENLERSGAKVIAFDVLFGAERDSAGDAIFRATLQKYDNIILAVKKEEEQVGGAYYLRSTDRRYSMIFYDVNKRVGYVDIPGKDGDGITRRYVPILHVGDFATPTFAFASLNRLFNLDPYTIPGLKPGYFTLADRSIPRFNNVSFLLNYYGPNRTFRYVDFQQAIDDSSFKTKDEIENETDINMFDEGTMSLFKDKIVLIGSTMPEERDDHPVPIENSDGTNQMHGVEIHATAIQNILDNNYITRADRSVEITLILLLSLISFLVILKIKQIRFRYVIVLEGGAALVVALLVLGIFEFALLSFTNGNTLINIVNPSLAVVLAYVSTIVYQYLTERQQKALIKNVFSHYISAAVVNELVANPDKAKLGGDKRELTVFFSDIAGFTSISEMYSNKPEGLVLLLNEYLDEMTAIILKHEGTLDKYEGDAIMAFWGAPIPQKDHAMRTCLAALDMQMRLAQLRPKWKRDGKPQLEVRCGINTGTMIVGNMGGKDRFDYTVIGDSVNLASRLEGANKQYGSNIMISDMTYQHVKGRVIVRELDLIQVKGKTEPVKVWQLLGTSDMKLEENEKQSLEIYQEGITLYRKRNWEEAVAYFNQAKQLDPTCAVAEIYAQRASLYRLNPPPDDWNGVFVMTTK
ncbi:MAG: CHASE2 domain-containing protein [Ignavibacteriales bacterium]|nr:CHASE2 domain-containing protein [Ignavibacteriales bacterium]